MTRNTYKTPGVKPIEKRVFGRTISSKITAVPIFIGYTQKIPRQTDTKKTSESIPGTKDTNTSKSTRKSSPKKNKEDAVQEEEVGLAVAVDTRNKPLHSIEVPKENRLYVAKINSVDEYIEVFGGGDYKRENKIFYLFESIKLFFINGGKTCYIISVGTYNSDEISKEELANGIPKIFEIQQANLVLIPDAVSLEGNKERGELYDELLKSCSFENRHGVFINQFALLDAKKGLKKHEGEEALKQLTSSDRLVHGAMYHPWLKTNVVTKADIEQSLLIEENLKFIETKFNLNGETNLFKDLPIKGKANFLRRQKRKAWNDFIKITIERNSLLPPSGAVAGAFVRSDEQFGIQKAPANINLKGVVELNAIINDANQRDFNAPDNGKSINCIRSFVNNDIKIWGARTLDCRDLDYRYVNVRRTMSMLQDAIKNLLEKFVFDDNNERTWLKIRASLSKFLKGMLRRGVLAGTTPSAAFEFSVGFGETMDEADIHEGIIRVVVKLALIRPAEFIEISFEQKSMEGGATVETETSSEG